MNWIKRLLGRRRLYSDLSDEIQEHLAEKIEELVASGMSREGARYAARREFGNAALIEERGREVWQWPSIENILMDVRYGLRMLRKNPAFTSMAVITLALGIGANAAIFSVVDTVLLKLLPVRDPQQLVLVGVANPKDNTASFGMPYPAYEHFRDYNRVFSTVLTYAGIELTANFDDFTTKANGELVSGSYFRALGINPSAGRTLAPQDDSLAAPAAAVLGYRCWRGRFDSDPNIVGKSILLNRVLFTIVGVAPPRFFGLQIGIDPEFYLPIAFEPRLHPDSDRLQNGSTWWLTIMGRLRPGVSLQKAQANLNQLFPEFLRAAVAQAPPDVPQSMKDVFVQQRVVLAPGAQGQSKLREQFRAPLLILLAVVVLVLFIACTNVANLVLAQATTRRREVAMRLALGAGRNRVIRQFLTESVLLAAAGGAAGLALAHWTIRLLQDLLSRYAALPDFQIDRRVILFTAGLSFIAGVSFGLFPAWRTAREDPGAVLKEGIEAVPSVLPFRLTLSAGLAVLQVSMSLVLLAGTSLLIRSLENLQHVDTGFTQRQVLLFSIDPTESGYVGTRLADFYGRLSQNLGALPGVHGVCFSASSPLSQNVSTTMISEFGTSPSIHQKSVSYRNIVSPNYFATLGIRLVAGRDFTERDDEAAPKVVIVNQTFARDYFGLESPLGRRLGYGPGQRSGPVEIVGVVQDSKYNSLREEHVPMVYLPYQQFPSIGSMTFALRARGRTALPLAAVRRQVGPGLPLTNVITLEEQVNESLLPERLTVTIASIFSFLALALTAVGIYGVVSHWASRRTHEIGVRLALGARRIDVLRHVVGQGFALTLTGVGIGIVGALGLTRLLASQLYGVKPTDPATFVAVSLVLSSAALLASYLPARRATKVDPMVALRYE
jgi:predicted permease